MQIRDPNHIKQTLSLKSNVWLFPYSNNIMSIWRCRKPLTEDSRISRVSRSEEVAVANGWCYQNAQREVHQILPSVRLFMEEEWMCFLPERSTLQWCCTWHQLWSVNIRVCGDAYLNDGDGSIGAYQRSVILESLLLFLLTFISRSTCANNSSQTVPKEALGLVI